MTHLEAQSYIMPFIEGKVPTDKQEDFVIHMRNCKKCHEELEVYYTLLEGMRQLDNRETMSNDLSKDLENELINLSHGVRNRRGFKLSAYSIFIGSIIAVFFLIYAGALNRIYNYEQTTKLNNQGQYYFGTVLEDEMQLDNIDRIMTGADIDKDKTITDYERIDGYIRLKQDYNNILDIGEMLNNGEALTD